MKVICISGHAQEGKDSTAGFLKDALENDGHKVLVTHYGDLVKYICRTFFGWNGEKDVAGRHILQYVGTDMVRTRYPNFWVDFIVDILTVFDDEWDYVLIPDCRFPNELERIREAGFEMFHIRVVRPYFDSPLTPEQKVHPSETSLDHSKPSFLITNDGDLEDLRRKVIDLIVELNGEHQISFDEL